MVVDVLLKNGAPVNFKDRNKVTPLFLAVNSGSCEAVQMLIGNDRFCRWMSAHAGKSAVQKRITHGWDGALFCHFETAAAQNYLTSLSSICARVVSLTF